MVTREQIARINELARKKKSPEGLTQAEAAERAALHRAYAEAVRENLSAQLERTVVQHPDGTRRPLSKKPKKSG